MSLLSSDQNLSGMMLKSKLIRLKMSKMSGVSESREIFANLLNDHHGEEHRVYLEIFNNSLGTCSETAYLLGHWDNDLGSILETFIKTRILLLRQD